MLIFLYKLLLLLAPIAIIIFALWLRKRDHAKGDTPYWYHPLLALLIAPSIVVFQFGVLISFINDQFGIVALLVIFALLKFSVFFYITALLFKPKSFSSTISQAIFITLILVSIQALSDGMMSFDQELIISWLLAFGMACFSGTIYWIYMSAFYKDEA